MPVVVAKEKGGVEGMGAVCVVALGGGAGGKGEELPAEGLPWYSKEV